jgi:hypothetical protein
MSTLARVEHDHGSIDGTHGMQEGGRNDLGTGRGPAQPSTTVPPVSDGGSAGNARGTADPFGHGPVRQRGGSLLSGELFRSPRGASAASIASETIERLPDPRRGSASSSVVKGEHTVA